LRRGTPLCAADVAVSATADPGRGLAWLLTGVLIAAAAALLVVPVAVLGLRVLDDGGSQGLVDPGIWGLLGRAAGVAGLGAGLAGVLGLCGAFAFFRFHFRGRRLAIAALTVPFVLPTVVVGLAFSRLLPDGLDRGVLPVVLATAYLNSAIVARVVGVTWGLLDRRCEQAAAVLGASPLRAFTSVTVPGLAPALLAGLVLAFLYAFTSVGIVTILGDRSTPTLELEILRRSGVLLDFTGAAVLAGLQALVILAVIAVAAAVQHRLTPAVARTARPLPALAGATTRERRAVLLSGTVVLTAALVPIAAIIVSSVRSRTGWTWQWWTGLGTLDAGTTRGVAPAEALAASLALALPVALIACALGGAATLLTVRSGRLWPVILASTPLVLSAATIALGLLLAYRAGGLPIPGIGEVPITGSGPVDPLLLAAHVLLCLPLVVAVSLPAARATDPRLADLAAVLGASPRRAWWTVHGPPLRRALAAGAALAGAVSLGEFTAASLLGRAGWATLPLQIERLLGRPGEAAAGSAAVLAVILALGAGIVVVLVDRFGGLAADGRAGT